MKKLFILSLLAAVPALTPQQASGQLSGRWYSYGDYIFNKASHTTGAASLWAMPMWQDPTANFGYMASGTPAYYANTFTSVGTSFTPRLSNWDSAAVFGSAFKVGPGDVYTIDSVRIYGVYMRNNARPAVKDTLKLAYVYGDGTSGSDMPSVGVTYPPSWSGTYINMPNLIYDASTNAAGQGASGPAPLTQTIVLSNTDTSSFFLKSYRLPVPLNVPVGQIAGVSLSFKSGDALYTPGDTIIYPSGVHKYGCFRPGIAEYEDALGNIAWAVYDPADSNTGFFKQQSLTWSGLYQPTWAWSTAGTGGPSGLQYPIMDFHVTCPNCELNDTIAGRKLVCAGAITTLTHTVSGGTWTSSNPAVATIGSASGVVMALATGTTNITYTVGTGNKAYMTLTVDPALAPGSLTGGTTACAGSSLILAPSVPGGSWSSSATSVATVSAAGIVSGVSGGTATISYTLSAACGSASATHLVTINALPVTGGLTGAATVCVGSTTAMIPGNAGGSWTTVTGKASVSASGIVNGINPGIDTVRYTMTGVCGTDVAKRAIMVIAPPVAGSISGPDSACLHGVAVLVDTSASVTGVWSAGNANATVAGGLVTGINTGTVTISYTVTNACGPVTATKEMVIYDCPTEVPNLGTNGISVYPNPVAGILAITSTTNMERITVWGITSTKVAELTVHGKSATINMSALPAGVYALQVDNGRVVRIVKQ